MLETELNHSLARGHDWRWARWGLAAATAVGLAIYLWGDGGCDDANITFRYAQHLAHGFGSVWNLGDAPSLGSSTPLWLVLLTLVERLWPGHIPLAANLAMAISWGLLAAVAWSIGEQLGWRRPWVAAAVLAAMAPLAAARMRGMETATYAALVAITYLVWLREPSGWKWGVGAGLCALARLDGWLVLGVFGLASVLVTRRLPLRAGAIAAALYLPWLGWQWHATGALVPQTMRAKALWPGCGRFSPLDLALLTAPPVVGTALWVALAAGMMWGLRERRLWPITAWAVIYCVAYRAAKLPQMGWYYMPLLLPTALLAAAGVNRSRFASSAVAGLALVSGLMMVVAGNPWFPRRLVYPPVTPRMTFEQHGLTRIGRWLRDNDPQASVLTNECGIIGYVSDCRVIDALGLVSRETWPYIPAGDFAGMASALRPDYIAWRVPERGSPLRWAPGYQWQKGWLDDIGWYGLYSRRSEQGSAAGTGSPSRRPRM